MKQSEVNLLCKEAAECMKRNGWALPPQPQWSACDFGLGDYRKVGLVELLLANEPEYCEKIMYAREGMVTPCHTHYEKKEDIIVRTGTLQITLWSQNPQKGTSNEPVQVKINGKMETRQSGQPFKLTAGNRITMTSGIWHEFVPVGDSALIGEVSTYCNEETDNLFADPKIDIFKPAEQDEPAACPA